MNTELLGVVGRFPWIGFERSVKIAPQSILWNRFLLGINKSDIPAEQLDLVCTELRMPASHLESLHENVGRSNQILFGFEEGGQATVYKVYLEFWTEVTAAVRSEVSKREPRLLHLGFKWSPADPSKSAVTRYTCFPLLSASEVINRVVDLYDGNLNRSGFKTTCDLLAMGAGRAPNASFIYMEAAEENNPRKSFDLNLYKASLRMPEIAPLLAQTAVDYSLPAQEFPGRLSKLQKNTFGHIAGGMDRHGRDFLTFYYEDAPPRKPVRPASSGVARNDPCWCGSGKKMKKCCGAA